VFPSVAETRNRQRLVYFDLYYEQYRCAARSCTVPAIIARLPKKQETANERLTEYGQKFYELVSKNEDVPVEIREKIADLLDKHPLMKKRYDELAAAGPKP